MCGIRQLDEEGEVAEVDEVPQHWPHRWLTGDMRHAFCEYFRAASQAFDELLFKPGRKHTIKCTIFKPSQHKLGRHNMIHYNFLIQQFHLLWGGQKALRDYEATFFFPLLKTPQVLRRLNEMWRLICQKTAWEFVPLQASGANIKQEPESDDDDDLYPVFESRLFDDDDDNAMMNYMSSLVMDE